MKVAEYRDLISELSDAFTDCQSCELHERPREAARMKKVARELIDAQCPRAKRADRDRAERMLDLTTTWLIENGLFGRAL